MSTQPTIAAEFYAGSAKRSPVLDITRIEGGRRTALATFPVKDRRQARKLAAQHGAEPWNF